MDKNINMKKDKISVVIPVYKSENYIIDCLKSVVNQTYQPFEIILISDGCIDKSIVIAKDFLSKQSIKYDIIEQTNQGVAVARNEGISKAKGDWIIAIDSDDCIYPHTFEIFMKNVLDEEVVVVDYLTNQPKDIEPAVSEIDIIRIDGEQAIEGYYSRKFKFVSPAMMIKKSFVENNHIRYDEGCHFAEDDIYVWKVLCFAKNILYLRKPLYNYIVHEQSTMTSTNIKKFISVKHFSDILDSNFIQKSPNTIHLKAEIIYRHYIGLVHAAAKVQNYKDYKYLIELYEMKKIYLNRFFSLHFKSKMLFSIPLLFPRLSYILFRYF